MSVTEGTTADISAMLRTAQARIGDGRFADALAICDEVLIVDPAQTEAHYIQAVAHRYQGNFDQSISCCDQILAINPANGRAYQEKGHCHRDNGNPAAALTSYQEAVARNSALLASWKAIALLKHARGQFEEASFAAAQADYLTKLPPELRSVASFIEDGRFQKAENLCRHYLQTHGHHVEAIRLLATIGVKFSAFDEAEFLLESALVIEPENISANFDYVSVLGKRQKHATALDQAAKLRAKVPGNAPIAMLYANQCLAVGDFEAALSIYREQAAAAPANPVIHLTIGHALKTIGQQKEAIEAYTQAYRVKPDYGDAYWSLANLKTYRFGDHEIAAMRAAEDAPTTSLVDRYHLCFALGKALEDRAEHAVSFAYYERGNRLKRDEVGYDWRRIAQEIDMQIDHVTPALIAQKAHAGCLSPDPIFIVGLPRAGSTLLEQILASHSQVEGTMELPNILALAHRLDGRRRVDEEARYPANLAELSEEELTQFGEAFIADTRIHRKAGTPFFIDKMPNNFRHIGLIHMILPKAKIIDARRHPVGCCFSGFKQLFAEGQEFTYGLEEVGRYYRDYVRLMDHWDTVLPGKILRVHYEDVVADVETQVRRLLDFCGLPYEDACVDFHQTQRAVRTASSEQVRQPIYTSGVDQWENYSAWLAPLRIALGPELTA